MKEIRVRSMQIEKLDRPVRSVNCYDKDTGSNVSEQNRTNLYRNKTNPRPYADASGFLIDTYHISIMTSQTDLRGSVLYNNLTIFR